MFYHNILLAIPKLSHTLEMIVLNLCRQDSSLHHLVILPELWKERVGEEWLTNVSEQIRSGVPIEGELEQEVQANVIQIQKIAEQQSIHYSFELVLGDPTECLFKIAEPYRFDLVVMGFSKDSTLPMNNQTLLRFLPIPLLMVPYEENLPTYLQVTGEV